VIVDGIASPHALIVKFPHHHNLDTLSLIAPEQFSIAYIASLALGPPYTLSAK